MSTIPLSNQFHVQTVGVDWREVLRDLASAGVSRYQVAEILETEPSTVQRWAEGSEPRHSTGMAILTIHARFCGETITQLRLDEAKPR